MAALVSSGGNGSTNGNLASVTLNTLGADLIVVFAGDISATMADDQGNTFQVARTQNGAFGGRLRIYYVENPTVNASHTFTLTGTTNSPVLSVLAFSGALTSGVLDQVNGVDSAGGTTIQPGTITPSGNGYIVVTVFGVFSDSTVTSISGSYTLGPQITGIAAQNWGGGTAWEIQGTAAATNPTWTHNSAFDVAAAIASFKTASGPSGNPWNYYQQQ